MLRRISRRRLAHVRVPLRVNLGVVGRLGGRKDLAQRRHRLRHVEVKQPLDELAERDLEPRAELRDLIGIQALEEPSGPGVRVDSGLYAGLQVPLFYDPLLSKLIVWGRDRTQAIARMRRALAEYKILGVRTTLPFDCWLMENPRFISGDLSTDFLGEEWETRKKHAKHRHKLSKRKARK